jgi:ParB family chromosome partitioning protein
VKLDLSGLEQFKASRLLADGQGGSPMDVALDLIDFDPGQPRRTLNEATLAELAASIKAQGVLEPVSLRRHPEVPGRYIVNRGERRVRASRLAGLVSVPAFIDDRVDPYAQVIENLQREDLTPFDLAQFVAERESKGETRAQIARRLHKPASFITELAELVSAPAPVREAFESGRARDTRVLYRLARGVKEQPEAVAPLLDGDAPITRDTLEAAFGMTDRSVARSMSSPGRKVQGTRLSNALVVEHNGRRGRIAWSRPPGSRTGEIQFADGSREVVSLAELRLIEWSGG